MCEQASLDIHRPAGESGRGPMDARGRLIWHLEPGKAHDGAHDQGPGACTCAIFSGERVPTSVFGSRAHLNGQKFEILVDPFIGEGISRYEILEKFREYIKNELELSSTDDLITEYEYYLNRHNIGASTFNFQ